MNILKKDFFWGNSVSSMQTEGAWDKGGKGLSVYDVKEASEFASDWKVATDSYYRYTEDFDFMKEMGMNCYRFQISWSRVNPLGNGEFNEEGIEFYDKFIDELIARGIEPKICLYHFDMPLHLAKTYNGFLSREVVDAFVRYGKEMLKRFSHKVKYWITLNEQNLYSTPKAFKYGGYLKGEETLEELYTISHHVMMAHTRFSNYLQENYPECKVGGMLTYMEFYPLTSRPKDVFVARQLDEFLNHNLLEAFTNGRYSREVLAFMRKNNLMNVIKEGDLEEIAKMRSDFLAFSYYASHAIDSTTIPEGTPVNYYWQEGYAKNPYVDATEGWGWQIDPLGLRNILTKMSNRYKIPLFINENGIGVQENWDGVNEIQDDYRIAYHRDHIQAMKDAIAFDGAEVIGYLGWGLIDILSSQGDMRKRYGMVYVNRDNHDLKDMKRIPKKSFYWMKNVTASNGENL
ncbi:glycoside hydrolase family 1 protein [Alkalicella caledoniensis]|uniref:Glycoside hydrolase family 1 protein n=1 Tax=Alkalicella caledoniensis TaxID=2731377 RepID=A0A7G9W5U4_ALKCA|nr:glycoside hydrolase family 1 protein [Alkalicella caledoniensis]QNO14056.1 glycoside hydrolase family 1 protein [Alkalicella caledoniensis]